MDYNRIKRKTKYRKYFYIKIIPLKIDKSVMDFILNILSDLFIAQPGSANKENKSTNSHELFRISRIFSKNKMY
jgi:hypothetical protein